MMMFWFIVVGGFLLCRLIRDKLFIFNFFEMYLRRGFIILGEFLGMFGNGGGLCISVGCFGGLIWRY